METLEQYKNEQKDKSSILIKIILPVISILIVLGGLIVLYQVGNVDRYVTNEMRIGFGYALSFGLLGGYLFDKVRSTVFAQIVLSGTLSALTLTTIIATHGYKIFPHFVGLGILGVLFFVGLLLARIHTSEIEFSTSALIGLSIPFFYSLDSFFMILVLEVIVVGALYLFLAFFKRVRFLHILVLILHVILSFVIIVQYSLVFKTGNYDWALNLYEILQLTLLWIPFFYLRRKFLTDSLFQIILILITLFCMVLAISFTFLQVQDDAAIRLHLAIVYVIIAMFLLIQGLILRDEKNSALLHKLSYIALVVGSIFFFEVFAFKLSAILTITFLHTWLLNNVFETEETENTWNKIINIVFGGIGMILGFTLLMNILSFVFRMPVVEAVAFHERFIPPTVLVLNYWLAYFFITPKRTYSFQKEFIFSLSWVFTALYFLYIPWQFMQLALDGNPTTQLVLLSVLWGIAAYTATIIGLKKGRIGLRMFTLTVVIFLLIKYVLADLPVFLEHDQAFGLAFYTIFFGIALLVLSALLIKEITKNGSQKEEWIALKRAFTIQKKVVTPVAQQMGRFNTFEEAVGSQQTGRFNTFEEAIRSQNAAANSSQFTPQEPQQYQAPQTYAMPEVFQELPVVTPEISTLPQNEEVLVEATQNEFVDAPEDTNDVVAPIQVTETQTVSEPVTKAISSTNIQIQIDQLAELIEEQGRFNENHIRMQEMQFEMQQMYIDSQKKMNDQMSEMLELLKSLKGDKEAN